MCGTATVISTFSVTWRWSNWHSRAKKRPTYTNCTASSRHIFAIPEARWRSAYSTIGAYTRTSSSRSCRSNTKKYCTTSGSSNSIPKSPVSNGIISLTVEGLIVRVRYNSPEAVLPYVCYMKGKKRVQPLQTWWDTYFAEEKQHQHGQDRGGNQSCQAPAMVLQRRYWPWAIEYDGFDPECPAVFTSTPVVCWRPIRWRVMRCDRGVRCRLAVRSASDPCAMELSDEGMSI